MTMAAFGICPALAHMLININKTPVRPEQCVAISLSSTGALTRTQTRFSSCHSLCVVCK